MYFETKGPELTDQTLELALKAAGQQGIGHMVVATTTGHTAQRIAALRPAGLHVVVVTHVQGMIEPGTNELSDEKRAAVEAAGIKVFTGTHALSGGERGVKVVGGGLYPLEIIAHTLRMMGQGTKVCVEIATMALDAGLIPYGEKIIAVGGTARGADTALVMTPSHAMTLFETCIHEVICKPLL